MSLKVLHLVYQSFPNISGSSTRTKQIIQNQKFFGFTPIVISSPCQEPSDIRYRCSEEVLNEIPHYRTYIFDGLSVGGRSTLVEKMKKIVAFPYFVYKVFCTAKNEKPDVLHSHAMFYCSLAALIVGKVLNIPTVYEVRSIWYANSNSNQIGVFKRIAIYLEHYVIGKVDAVVAISDGIKSQFKNLRDDIYIVRNAIDSTDIDRKKIVLKNPVVKFGYVGSVIELEGLDFVIKAFSILQANGVECEFHIFGGGNKLDYLKKLAEELDSPVKFHGKFSFEHVSKCYEEIDCVINYRKNESVAHLVTPLKPLEAICFNKPVVCSDVNGYVEILGGYDNAIFVEPENLDLLVETLASIVSGSVDNLFNSLNNAKEFVVNNRTWNSNMYIYEKVYNHASN